MTVDREKVAKAIFDAMTGDLVFWEDAVKAKKVKFLAGVNAALASIEAQDHVIVPVTLLTALSNAIDADEELSVPMTDTQEEVKPCPFCGSVPNVAQIENDGSNDDWAVECCGCDWVCTDTYFGRKNAITAWNTRPTEDALRAEILTLIANNGQLIEDNLALTARVEELEGALMRVIGAVSYDQVDIRRWLDEARSILNK